LQVHSTCFGRFLRPSSGVLKTVVAATGACHSVNYKVKYKQELCVILGCIGITDIELNCSGVINI